MENITTTTVNRAWSATPVASACSHDFGAPFGAQDGVLIEARSGAYRTSVVMPAGYRTVGAVTVTTKHAPADFALSTLFEGAGRRRWSPPTT